MAVSVVCPACKTLVSVVDKTIAEHGECPVSGMHYAPSPRFQRGPGGPSVQVIASKTGKCSCGHPVTTVLLKVTQPDVRNN